MSTQSQIYVAGHRISRVGSAILREDNIVRFEDTYG